MTEKTFLVRGMDEGEVNALDTLAHQRRITRQALVSELIRQEIDQNYIKPIILGWVKLDRWGELNADEVCDECGQDLDMTDGVYIGLMSDGNNHGPVCTGCATNE